MTTTPSAVIDPARLSRAVRTAEELISAADLRKLATNAIKAVEPETPAFDIYHGVAHSFAHSGVLGAEAFLLAQPQGRADALVDALIAFEEKLQASEP